MTRELDPAAARAAAYGGLVFGAGGTGIDSGLAAARPVFEVGRPVLVSLDELDDDDQIIVTSGVGAPGVSRRLEWTHDRLRAIDMVVEAYRGSGRVVGVMTGHPSSWSAAHWLISALRPDLAVVDCNTNGRGHPTVAMGGMGLAGRLDVAVTHAVSGGDADHLGHIELVATGPLGSVSSILHHVSATVGGSVASARGPFSAHFTRLHGAVGSVSACIELGESMLAAKDEGGQAMVDAIVGTLEGRELGRGPLVDATMTRREAWDVGTLVVDAGGSKLDVIVINEYMAVDVDGVRVATYPDLIVTLDPESGLPTSAAHMEQGAEVIVIAVSKQNIPLGSGVWDASVYADVERVSGHEIARYALDGAET